jgi:ligand-binding SRPBCC domain-containing protein
LIFQHESKIGASAQEVFEFHERPDALRLLIPPGQPIRIVEHTGGIKDGARVILRIGYWPFTIRWVALHQGYIAGREFQDLQVSGPFRYWLHTHTVIPVTFNSCILRDHIEYQLLAGKVFDRLVKGQLLKTFQYRHQVTARETSATGIPA